MPKIRDASELDAEACVAIYTPYVTDTAITFEIEPPTAADDWLIRKGNRFGLCQTLSNEMWHFELVTTPGGTCPPMTKTAS